MNWLLILIVALWAFFMVRGYKKGMLRMIYSLISWIVILILVTLATPHVADFLAEKTPIEESIQKASYEKLKEMVNGAEESDDKSDGKANAGISNKEALAALGLKLPDELVDELVGDESLADSFFESSGLYDKVSQKISSLALTGISFVLSLLILAVAAHFLYNLIKIVEDVPVISAINRTLGAALGCVKGLILVWVVFAIIAMSGTSTFGLMMTSYIYESIFLSALYENNLILTLLLLVVG